MMKTKSFSGAAPQSSSARARTGFGLAVSLALLAIALQGQALNPAYLAEMPSVAQVTSQIGGSDGRDTAARQMGAFLQLNTIIENLSGPRWARNQLTPDEQRIMQLYRTAQFRIQETLDEPIIRALKGYDIDPDFRAELLTRFFSPAFQTRYIAVDADMRSRIQARRNADPLRTPPPAGASPAAVGAPPCPVSAAPTAARPPARGISTLSLLGTGYVYTFARKNEFGRVVESFTEKGNFSDTTFYLLDDDAEKVLQSAGIGPGLLGSRFAMMTMFEVGTGVEGVPGVSLLLGGLASGLSGLAKADFECGMTAIRNHSVAQITTDANGRANSPGLPAGTYYLYGRFYRVSKPTPSGGLYWNLKVDLKPGQSTVRVSVDNAAWRQP
jgi:hypothetical protein